MNSKTQTLSDIRRSGVLVHLRVKYEGREWTTPARFRWLNGKWQTEQKLPLPGHLAVIGYQQTQGTEHDAR